jgi:hypothetical protein
MNCNQFKRSVRELVRDELPDADTRELSLSHAAKCSNCSTRLAHERALHYGIASVMTDVARHETPPRVETILLAAFQKHLAESSFQTASRVRSEKPFWIEWKIGFAFALALIFVSVPSVYWMRARFNSAKPKITPAPESQNISIAPIVSLPLVDNAIHEERTSPRKQLRRHPVRSQSVAEEVTEFFPLAEGDDLTLLETEQIARVELPPSALVELGLRVGPETPQGVVKADILLSHDGQPRAIRFVR